jgi:23S rRNA (adenine2503-C2)-methyltransferase
MNFYDLTLPKLRDYVVANGFERFRADQLYRWVYGFGVTDFSLMTNMSKKVREEMPKIFEFRDPKMVTHLVSTDGTEKFLFDLSPQASEENPTILERQTVEAVLIPAGERLTLCVSSEVGCNMACKFCFTGKQKMKRRLTAGEIVAQYRLASQEMKADRKITNIVFMGMGEPLDNPEAVFDSIEILHEPSGYNLSRKKITVSTSGIVPLIPRITASGARLAVSLNAVNDRVRDEIMPINKKWPLEQLLEACRVHCRETGDRVTLEYVLLKGVTDSIEDAHALFKLTKDVPCKINIIPFNEHPGSGFLRPSEAQIVKFQNTLINLGAHVLRRKTMGRDIYAACGQLRSAYKDHPKKFDINNTTAPLT